MCASGAPQLLGFAPSKLSACKEQAGDDLRVNGN